MTYPVRGTVKDGEKVLLEGVDTWVDFVDSLSGTRSWRGQLVLPGSKHIEPGGPYRLELEDGRAGDIFVTLVPMSGEDEVVKFSVTGPISQ